MQKISRGIGLSINNVCIEIKIEKNDNLKIKNHNSLLIIYTKEFLS